VFVHRASLPADASLLACTAGGDVKRMIADVWDVAGCLQIQREAEALAPHQAELLGIRWWSSAWMVCSVGVCRRLHGLSVLTAGAEALV